MALLAQLIASAAAAFGIAPREAAPAVDDEHLAATALLVHVARADGVLAEVETDRLRGIVRKSFAGSDADADALIARARAFDAETRDMTVLTELIGREGSADERVRLLAMAWSVAGADGAIHEFEEALVWRLGTLLGLDEAAIAAARGTAQAEPVP